MLSATWLYIQTSISEGLPVSVIEAGLTGKCVVCTNVGGCAELLANPNAGARVREGVKGPQGSPLLGTVSRPERPLTCWHDYSVLATPPLSPKGADGSSHGLAGPQPPMFGRLVAPKDAEMVAYAQLECLGFLPTLQVREAEGTRWS